MDNLLTNGVGRRTFLKGLGITFLAPVIPEVMAMPINKPPYKYLFDYSELKSARSSCAMECLHCNLTAYTYKGELIKVEASKDFNVKACMRGLSRTKWVNHKERLTTPLLRTGEKGSGEFKAISWDEALNLMEQNIRKTIAEDGNKGLMFVGFTGNMDAVKNDMGRAFFDYLGGCTRRSGSICCGAAYGAIPPITGIRFTDTRDTIADSKYLLCWGNNPAVTLHAYWKDFIAAQKNGARIVVIDPRFSETAAKADEWIPITPGTDSALALGMMRVIIEEGLTDIPFLKNHTGAIYLVGADGDLARYVDPNLAATSSESSCCGGKTELSNTNYLVYDLNSQSYVAQNTPGINPALFQSELPADSPYTTVFEKVRQECEQWTLAKTSEVTSIPQHTIARLARDFGTVQPAMIIFNMSGAQRTENGAHVVATQHYLALLTGNMGKRGAGILDAGGATQMVKFGPLVPPAPNKQKIATIPMARIGQAIIDEDPHKISFLYSMAFAPLNQLPNTNKVKEAFKKVPFVVVADNLMTDSAKWADLVLPVTTIFEDVSLMAGPRSHYVQLMEKAVDAPGQAKPDYWIFARLAERFGFGEVFNQPIEHYINNLLAGTGITLEQLKKGPVKPANFPWVPFDGGKFNTPTGRANFFLEAWKAKGHPAIATHVPVIESSTGNPELAKKYPLMSVQRKLARTVHTSHGINEWVNQVQRNVPNIMIHPDDAAARGIKSGDRITAFNDRGEHTAIADVSSFMMRGVVSLENGWWERQGGTSSTVTSDFVEPIGHGQACNSTLVEVRLAKV